MRSGAGYKLARQAAFVELSTDEGLKGYGPVLVRQRVARPRLRRHALRQHLRACARGRGPAPHRAPLGQDLLRLDRARPRAALASASRSCRRSTSRSGTSRARRSARRSTSCSAARSSDPVPAYSSSVYWSTPEDAVEQAQRVPRQGLQGLQGQGRPRRRERHRVAARDPRATSATASTSLVDANQCYTRHLALQGRPRAGEARRALLRGAAADRRRRRPRVPRRQARRPHRDRREHVHALGLPAVLPGAGDPRRAGGRLALRRHQRGEADLRPRRRLPPARHPAHVLGRAHHRGQPACRRRLVERAR